MCIIRMSRSVEKEFEILMPVGYKCRFAFTHYSYGADVIFRHLLHSEWISRCMPSFLSMFNNDGNDKLRMVCYVSITSGARWIWDLGYYLYCGYYLLTVFCSVPSKMSVLCAGWQSCMRIFEFVNFRRDW